MYEITLTFLALVMPVVGLAAGIWIGKRLPGNHVRIVNVMNISRLPKSMGPLPLDVAEALRKLARDAAR